MATQPRTSIAIASTLYDAAFLAQGHDGQDVLSAAHHKGIRPRCMCQPSGVELYINRRNTQFFLAKVPGSGFLHSSGCPFAEAAHYLSGADAYASGTVQHLADGGVVLNTQLQRRARQSTPLVEVSIDGLFAYLIEAAGLNQVAAADPPRTWVTVRNRLLEAASELYTTAGSVMDRLLVPAHFTPDIAPLVERSNSAFLVSSGSDALICAPLKEIRTAPHGWLLLLKHLPSMRFWLQRSHAEEIERRVGYPILTHPPPYSLCLLSVRPARQEGSFTVQNAAFLATDRRFFPSVGGSAPDHLMNLLAEGRTILRPLAFDAGADFVSADYLLLDTDPATPVFISDAHVTPDRVSARTAMLSLLERHHVPSRMLAPINRSCGQVCG